MESAEQDLAVYECGSCGEIRLAHRELSCCGESMGTVDATVPSGPPEMEGIMRDVYGIGRTELDVCRTIMTDGESTIRELADRIDRDRTVVSRHVNHLVDLGLLEKESRVLSGGGRVNVYAPVPGDVARRQLKRGLYAWFIDAAAAVDRLSQEKIQAMAREQTAEATDEGDEADGDDRTLMDRLLS
jgi:predicted transcriptional regulator